MRVQISTLADFVKAGNLFFVPGGEEPGPLPADIFELLTTAIQHIAASVNDEQALPVLTKLAVANHRAGRREFTSADVDDTLTGDSWTVVCQRALWARLNREGAIPLLETLQNDTVLRGKKQTLYQFKALSLQEVLAVEELILTGCARFAAWDSDEKAAAYVHDAFNHNLLRIGAARLGLCLSKRRAAWDFADQMIGDAGTGVVAALMAENVNLVHLNLESNKLGSPSGGALAAVLGDCTALRTLNLCDNKIDGNIPGIPLIRCVGLRELQLSRNCFSGPVTMGRCAALQLLDLSHNQLSGPLPEVLCRCIELREVRLNDNQLSGPLPSAIGRCIRLQALLLSNNRFDGALPETLGQLQALRELWLDGNRFEGLIPRTLGKLVSLERLRCAGNRLTGTVPDTLGGCVSLKELSLSSNRLDGLLPAALSKCTAMQTLMLGGNDINTPIPEAVRSLPKLIDVDLTAEGTSPRTAGVAEAAMAKAEAAAAASAEAVAKAEAAAVAKVTAETQAREKEARYKAARMAAQIKSDVAGGPAAIAAARSARLPPRQCSAALSGFLVNDSLLRSQYSECSACLAIKRLAAGQPMGAIRRCRKHEGMLAQLNVLRADLQIPQDSTFDHASWLRAALTDAGVVDSVGKRL